MSTPVWAEAQWWEVHFRSPQDPSRDKRIDRRRRTKATAERIAAELRASGNFLEVWLVEVNRAATPKKPDVGDL